MARLFTEEEVRQMITDAVAKAVAPLKAQIAELEAEIARLKKGDAWGDAWGQGRRLGSERR